MTTRSEDVNRLFAWEDYAVFAAMLIISAAIGVYHGFSWKKKKSEAVDVAITDEFLLGRGKMQTLPVALSMLASFLSSITLMGQPAEVYLYGPGIWLLGVATFLAVPVASYIFVPFFRKLNAASAYEYFGRRFNRKFQLLASSIFTLHMLIFLALVLYAPALALHQVTGINTDVVLVIMYVVCIFYTTVGGIKAVVWTDSFQVVILYAAMIAVLIKGTIDIGGIDVVLKRNIDHQRGDFFDFNPDPTKRYTVWTSLIGGCFLHIAVLGGNQLQIQRYLTVRTEKEVRNILWINAVGWTIVVLLTAYAGMLIFAHYFECDPLMNHQIQTADQLFPLYVMDVLGTSKGFPGLFVAGIFSAGLSTVATGVNSLAAIWFSELDGTDFKAKLSPRKAGFTVKALALCFGLLSFGIVFLVPFMGALVPIAISLNGFFSGSLLGVFLLGIYIPFANSWGAFFGLVSGVAVVSWITVGVQVSVQSGLVVSEAMPLTTEGCLGFNGTFATTIAAVAEREEAFAPYRISFMWYSFIAMVVTIGVGAVVSFITECMSPTIPVNEILRKGKSFQKTVSKDWEMETSFFPLRRRSKEAASVNVYLPPGRDAELKLIENKTKVPIKLYNSCGKASGTQSNFHSA